MKRLVLLWLASLVTVAAATATFTLAQARQPEPRILSGADIGFRVEGRDPRTGSPTGALMVRLNGEWVEVGASGGTRLLK
jgi:hypothetical protein